jgi:predicted ATPase
LAPLILFLKYLVRPGDMLILEEPESHLHPAAQRRMAQGIVRLVNAGVKVIITTHSDMFVGQINNFLALSQASQELIGEHGFEPSDFLKHDQVGAYLFKHDQEKRGSVIQPLGIDSDTGIDEDEFADVTEAIYNESIALQRDRIL